MRSRLIVMLSLSLLIGACNAEDRAGTPPPAAVVPAAPATVALDVAPPALVDEHAHQHDAGLERPPGGGNWATDAPLRQGMESIHGAMASALPAFEKGELSAAAATELASEVQTQVQSLIANCKLEPAADAQLHIVIGQMLAAAEALAKDPMSGEGMPRLHQTVKTYPFG